MNGGFAVQYCPVSSLDGGDGGCFSGTIYDWLEDLFLGKEIGMC